MNSPWEVYDLLLDYAESQVAVEEVVVGTTWTLCHANGTGLAMSPEIATRTLSWSGTLRGKPIAELQQWVRSWDPHAAAVGMAAVNASINGDSELGNGAIPIINEAPANLAVFEHFLPRLRGKRVAVVGRYPDLERYADQLNLTVLERQPGNGDLPDPACEFVLPEADWVFLTATSLTNKTFPRLAQLAQDSNLVLMGPTVPWLEELAEFGVDFLAGVQVYDQSALRQTVAEGGGRRIFESGVRYQIADLGAGEMGWMNSAIGDLVQHRERLKGEMEAWYAGVWHGTFPRAEELVNVDRELSKLDSRFKRMWDARNPRGLAA